jgi:endonuclease G, mitochondrial
MNKRLSFLFLLIGFLGFSQEKSKISNLEIPFRDSNAIVIQHTAYSLEYCEKHEQAYWVAYELTKSETEKKFERTDKFIVDPTVSTGTANAEDYAKSGYDRGHLAPAGDMAWSEKSMIESFYYSNMSPQLPGFNRGIWKRLEELVRDWAIENESIYVVTGPILKKDLPTIGADKVSVPERYYKVILDYKEPSLKAIAFVLPNESSQESLTKYVVSIDSVEILTGIDFFPKLDDKEETRIEKTVCISCWTWNVVAPSSNSTNKSTVKKTVQSEERLKVSVQCKGMTKAGNRCKNKTLNASGKCYLHEDQ